MAYKSDLVQEVVKKIKVTDFTEIRISKMLDKNNIVQSIDIRQWYCISSDPEMKPSSKGLRIKDEFCADLLDGIIDACSPETLADLVTMNEKIDFS